MGSITTFLVFVIMTTHCQATFVLQSAKSRLSEEEVEARAEAYALVKVCDNTDEYAPCVCKEYTTSTIIRQDDGSHFTVEFPEYACNKIENKKRKKQGFIAPGYKCEQLMAHRILYRDQLDNPIKVHITYKGGCEIRCVNQNCQHAENANTTKSDADGLIQNADPATSKAHRDADVDSLSAQKANDNNSNNNNNKILHGSTSKPQDHRRSKLKNICLKFASLGIRRSLLCKSVIGFD